MTLSLESTLCSAGGFGLVKATPVQRAICRCVDGLPLGPLAALEDVQTAFGGPDACAALPLKRPAEVLLLAAIRSGKSMLAAAAAVRASQTCDLSRLGAGETPRVSVVSLTLDLGHAVFEHIVGNVLARPALRALLIGDPTADTVILRHPSGRAVEIKVVAGAKAGASLVARWSAAAIFDEAPRMSGSEDAVVSFDESRRYVLGRLLPGAQILSIGSPWAPFGPIYDAVQAHWGKPSRNLVVIRATGPAMNPSHWTPKRCAELQEQDPIAYRTDVLGEFADPEAALFEDEDLRAATRAAPPELPPDSTMHYAAAMDPATRANAWTLAIAGRAGSNIKIAVARQWKPRRDAKLSPAAVLDEIASVCRAYGISVVHSDGWSADAIGDLARARGITIDSKQRSTEERVDLFTSLKTLIAQGTIELPPIADVRSDLLSVRKRVTQRGVSIELPKTSDGRHADFAPAIALAVRMAPSSGGGFYTLADLDMRQAEQDERELLRGINITPSMCGRDRGYG